MNHACSHPITLTPCSKPHGSVDLHCDDLHALVLEPDHTLHRWSLVRACSVLGEGDGLALGLGSRDGWS